MKMQQFKTLEDITQQILDTDRFGTLKYSADLVFIAGDNDIWNDWDNNKAQLDAGTGEV